MRIQLLFFSVLRDITHTAEETCTLPAEVITVEHLLQHLYTRWPELQRWDGSLLVAVDQVYARRSDLLTPGAEVAIMPPVQGG
jgi:molybdopterin synthase sulfur carrier subunit